MDNGTGLSEVWKGFNAVGDEPRIVAMWAIAAVLLYLGIARNKQPLLLVPMAMGILLANAPLGVLVSTGSDGASAGFLKTLQESGLNTGVLALVMFMGVGAAVDFEPMLANPKLLLLGAGAQIGILVAVICAVLLGMIDFFDLNLADAAAIGMIGGADGPSTIFVANRMHEIARGIDPAAVSLVGATAVAVYAYMALVPIIQPPIIRLFTTQAERKIRMDYPSKPVSKRIKLLFPVVTTIIVGLIAPHAASLVGMLMVGNLVRESGVVPRLTSGMDNLMNIAIVLLGLAVGATMTAEVFLQPETLAVFVLGIVAFASSTVTGILLAKLMNLVTKTPVNPMIGAAGVSVVPIAARVVNDLGREEDPQNFLLGHAMGPNVAGVIGTAVVAGVLLAVVPALI